MGVFKITKNDEIKICEAYNNGVGPTTLSKKYNCTRKTIYNCLNRNNIKLSDAFKKKFNYKQEVEIIKLYENFESMKSIADKYNVGYTTINTLLNKYNVKINNVPYSLNNNYFENIDTLDKAYFLGFLYADGGISKNRTRFDINLKKEDEYILQLLLKKMNCIGNVNIRTYINDNKEYVSVGISDEKIYNDLILWRCTPIKSFTIRFPENLPDDMFWHFIRGMFDGDGWFSFRKYGKSNPQWSIASNVDFCKDLVREFEKRNIKLNFTQRVLKSGKIHGTVSIYKIVDIKIIFDNLYNNCENVFLSRKYLKMSEYIKKYFNEDGSMK